MQAAAGASLQDSFVGISALGTSAADVSVVSPTIIGADGPELTQVRRDLVVHVHHLSSQKTSHAAVVIVYTPPGYGRQVAFRTASRVRLNNRDTWKTPMLGI